LIWKRLLKSILFSLSFVIFALWVLEKKGVSNPFSIGGGLRDAGILEFLNIWIVEFLEVGKMGV